METMTKETERPVDFDGVFRFTNASDTEFTAMWNNKEYVFPAKSTCRLIIEGETLENIQEIRKRFALKYAQREYFKSKSYNKIRNGDGMSVLSMFDLKVMQPYVDQCLEPLPVAEVVKKPAKSDKDTNYKSSKGVGKKDSLNEMFKDTDIPELGEMGG